MKYFGKSSRNFFQKFESSSRTYCFRNSCIISFRNSRGSSKKFSNNSSRKSAMYLFGNSSISSETVDAFPGIYLEIYLEINSKILYEIPPLISPRISLRMGTFQNCSIDPFRDYFRDSVLQRLLF